VTPHSEEELEALSVALESVLDGPSLALVDVACGVPVADSRPPIGSVERRPSVA